MADRATTDRVKGDPKNPADSVPSTPLPGSNRPPAYRETKALGVDNGDGTTTVIPIALSWDNPHDLEYLKQLDILDSPTAASLARVEIGTDNGNQRLEAVIDPSSEDGFRIVGADADIDDNLNGLDLSDLEFNGIDDATLLTGPDSLVDDGPTPGDARPEASSDLADTARHEPLEPPPPPRPVATASPDPDDHRRGPVTDNSGALVTTETARDKDGKVIVHVTVNNPTPPPGVDAVELVKAVTKGIHQAAEDHLRSFRAGANINHPYAENVPPTAVAYAEPVPPPGSSPKPSKPAVEPPVDGEIVPPAAVPSPAPPSRPQPAPPAEFAKLAELQERIRKGQSAAAEFTIDGATPQSWGSCSVEYRPEGGCKVILRGGIPFVKHGRDSEMEFAIPKWNNQVELANIITGIVERFNPALQEVPGSAPAALDLANRLFKETPVELVRAKHLSIVGIAGEAQLELYKWRVASDCVFEECEIKRAWLSLEGKIGSWWGMGTRYLSTVKFLNCETDKLDLHGSVLKKVMWKEGSATELAFAQLPDLLTIEPRIGYAGSALGYIGEMHIDGTDVRGIELWDTPCVKKFTYVQMNKAMKVASAPPAETTYLSIAKKFLGEGVERHINPKSGMGILAAVHFPDWYDDKPLRAPRELNREQTKKPHLVARQKAFEARDKKRTEEYAKRTEQWEKDKAGATADYGGGVPVGDGTWRSLPIEVDNGRSDYVPGEEGDYTKRAERSAKIQGSMGDRYFGIKDGELAVIQLKGGETLELRYSGTFDRYPRIAIDLVKRGRRHSIDSPTASALYKWARLSGNLDSVSTPEVRATRPAAAPTPSTPTPPRPTPASPAPIAPAPSPATNPAASTRSVAVGELALPPRPVVDAETNLPFAEPVAEVPLATKLEELLAVSEGMMRLRFDTVRNTGGVTTEIPKGQKLFGTLPARSDELPDTGGDGYRELSIQAGGAVQVQQGIFNNVIALSFLELEAVKNKDSDTTVICTATDPLDPRYSFLFASFPTTVSNGQQESPVECLVAFPNATAANEIARILDVEDHAERFSLFLNALDKTGGLAAHIGTTAGKSIVMKRDVPMRRPPTSDRS